ncbi:MAG: PEP-CTERM sorting domain-containing protein [Phycisphaerae bacterium]
MSLRSRFGWLLSVVCGAVLARPAAAGGTFAGNVVEYVPGAITSAGLQQSANATLGLPASVDDGETSPFSPPFHASSITVVGGGGHLTLQFAQPVIPAEGADIGVFTNTGLVAKITSGTVTASTAANGNAATFSTDAAIVSVSDDGTRWFALNNDQPLDLTMPSNAFTDGTLSSTAGIKVSGGTVGADPYKRFTGTLKDFAGLAYPEMLTLLDGSFGGAWLDASGTGLPEINMIRFDVPAGDRLVLDAVTASGAVPEPATAGALALGAAALITRRRRGPRYAQTGFRFSRKGESMHKGWMIGAVCVALMGAANARATTRTVDFTSNPLTDPSVVISGPDAANAASRFTYDVNAHTLTAHYDTTAPTVILAFPLAQHITDRTSFSFAGTLSVNSAGFVSPATFGGQVASFGLINSTTTGDQRATAATDGTSYDIAAVDYFPTQDSTFGGNSADLTLISAPSAGSSFNDHFSFAFDNLSLPLDTSVTMGGSYDAATRDLTLTLNGSPIASGTFAAGQSFDFDSLALTLWNDPNLGTFGDPAAAAVTFSSLSVTSTPEPSSIAVLGLGVALLVKRRAKAGL